MLRRVSKELYPFVSWALHRDNIPFAASDKGEYMELALEGVSSRRFTNAVEDAKCEKERKEGPTPDIPVLSYRAAMNPTRMKELLDSYGADCFVVYGGESGKFRDAVIAV